MGNVASVGLVKEGGFTTTKSLLDINTIKIKSGLGSCQEIEDHVSRNINKKLSADCNAITANQVSQSDATHESSFAITSLLSLVGLTGSECPKLLDAVQETLKMNITQAACDGTEAANVKSESNIMKVNRNKRTVQLNNRVMPPPTRKNGCVTQVEENNLCVFNFMWVCSYGSFTAVPRAYNRLTRNRSVPPLHSPLMKAVKCLQLNTDQMLSSQSSLTRISALSRRNQANAYRNRHLRRTQLQAPLPATAAVTKAKLVQNCGEIEIVDGVVKRKRPVEGKSSRKIQNVDPNNNDDAKGNNKNINSSVINISTKSVKNGGNNPCGNKVNGKSKMPPPVGSVPVTAAVNVVGRKLPTFAQQPPQKFILGNPRNRKHYRAPLTLSSQKLTTTRRPKSHSLSCVSVFA
uniref:Uncharacterized protein n=1 Tax=Plectus sambesii TaxID=2011161 RepID=A0A914W0P8_9BILA